MCSIDDLMRYTLLGKYEKRESGKWLRVDVDSEVMFVDLCVDQVIRATTKPTPTPHNIHAAPRREKSNADELFLFINSGFS